MFTQIPNAHTEVVTSLVFSPHVVAGSEEGGLLCSTSGDDTTALWDMRAGSGTSQLAVHLAGHHVGPVNHALFHPADVNALLTASDDCTIACWDLRRPDKVVGKISGFQEGVNKMLWLPVTSAGCGGSGGGDIESGWNVVSACDDGHVYVHALALPDSNNSSSEVVNTALDTGVMAVTGSTLVPQVGALVDKFRVSTSTVNDIVLAPNSTSTLITASEDCTLRSWMLRPDQRFTNMSAGTMDDRLLASLDEFENPVNHVVVVPPGLMGVVNSSAEPNKPKTSPAGAGEVGHGGGVSSSAFSRSQASAENEDRGEDSEEGGAGSDGGAYSHARTSASISEAAGTGCWLLAACSECVFGVDFALRSGQFGNGALAFIGHHDYVRGLEFTNEGTLLTVSDDSMVIEWNLSTTDPIRQMKLHEGMIMSSALSPSRTLFATGTDRGEIRVWRLPFDTERLSRD